MEKESLPRLEEGAPLMVAYKGCYLSQVRLSSFAVIMHNQESFRSFEPSKFLPLFQVCLGVILSTGWKSYDYFYSHTVHSLLVVWVNEQAG